MELSPSDIRNIISRETERTREKLKLREKGFKKYWVVQNIKCGKLNKERCEKYPLDFLIEVIEDMAKL